MDRTSPNVLSVGTVEYNSAARRALLASGRAHIWTATSLSELRRIGDTHEFGVVVLRSANSQQELQRRAKYARRNWPRAVILLIESDAEALEGQLHDHRIPRVFNSDETLSFIEQLAKEGFRDSEASAVRQSLSRREVLRD